MTFKQKPPGRVTVQINVRVPYEYRAFLQERARSQKISFNQLILRALAGIHPHKSVDDVLTKKGR